MMLIKAEVFRALAEAHEEWRFKVHPIYCFGNPVPNREYTYDFFQMGVDRETQDYTPEDFFFCSQAKRLGFDTFVLPSVRTVHTGSFDFTLNLPAIASLGAAQPAKGSPQL